METIILKYFTTCNIILDSLLMYFFIEYLSSFKIIYFIEKIKHFNYNIIKTYINKNKYKTVTLYKKRIRLITKFKIENVYETTNEIDAVINYIYNNTEINHYNFLKENFNEDENSKSNTTQGYLEPSKSVYNLELRPFLNNSNIRLGGSFLIGGITLCFLFKKYKRLAQSFKIKRNLILIIFTNIIRGTSCTCKIKILLNTKTF